MLVTAQLIAPETDRRAERRHRSNAMARVRQLKSAPEMIHVTDLSCEGCGFRSRYAFAPGTRILLNLPGLEVWLATIAWYENGRGGLKFDRPLHPAVAERFAAGE